MFGVSDDDYTGAVGEGHDGTDEELGWGVRPGARDESNVEAGGGSGEPPVVDLT